MWLIVALRYAMGMRKEIEKIWSEIDEYLRKRHDLLPGVVEILRRYGIEEGLVNKAIDARDSARKIYFPDEVKAKAEKLYADKLMEILSFSAGSTDMDFLEYKKEIMELNEKISNCLDEFNFKIDHFNIRRSALWMRSVCFLAKYKAISKINF